MSQMEAKECGRLDPDGSQPLSKGHLPLSGGAPADAPCFQSPSDPDSLPWLNLCGRALGKAMVAQSGRQRGDRIRPSREQMVDTPGAKDFWSSPNTIA